jgi:hypothetical protein
LNMHNCFKEEDSNAPLGDLSLTKSLLSKSCNLKVDGASFTKSSI